MSSSSKITFLVFGVSLVLVGLVVFFSGGVSLPARRPPAEFHFSGASLLMLGLAPLSLGSVFVAIGRGTAGLDSRAAQLGIGAGLAFLGLAFLLAT